MIDEEYAQQVLYEGISFWSKFVSYLTLGLHSLDLQQWQVSSTIKIIK